MALDIRHPKSVCLGDGQRQLAWVTAHIGFELALSSQIVGIGFLQWIRVQYAIIQHRFTLVKFDMQLILINKLLQLILTNYLDIDL
ncbi:hypothetical protein D3C85_1568940 [compost metagenome]